MTNDPRFVLTIVLCYSYRTRVGIYSREEYTPKSPTGASLAWVAVNFQPATSACLVRYRERPPLNLRVYWNLTVPKPLPRFNLNYLVSMRS
jgi:hypothetical protein